MNSKPFGPALNAACNLLSAQFQTTLNQILNEEAVSLGLAEGWQADVPQRVWILPEPKADETPVPALVKD